VLSTATMLEMKQEYHPRYRYAMKPTELMRIENNHEHRLKRREETMPVQFQERDVLSLDHLKQLNNNEDVI
jgi:hypothetical protein